MKSTANPSKPPLHQVKPIKDVLDNIIANKKESLIKHHNDQNKTNLINRKTPIEPLKDSRALRAKRTGSSKELDTKPSVGLLAFHSETLNNRKPQMNLRYNFSPVRGSNQKEIMFQDSTNKSTNRGSNSGALAARKNHKIFVDNAQSSLANKPFTYKISPKNQATHQIKLGGGDNLNKKPALPKGDFYARKDERQNTNTSPRHEKNPSLNVNKMNLSSPVRKEIKARYQKEGVEAKPVLILLDHDLGFLKDYLICFDIPCNFICEKLYSFDYENHQNPGVAAESLEKKGRLTGYAGIFIFLKFSPRVKSSSLKMLQKLVNTEGTREFLSSLPNLFTIECLVVKCLLAVESVDLNLDYENESMTIEKKKRIEHNLFLEKQTFDAYSIGYQEVSRLEEFFKSKLNLY